MRKMKDRGVQETAETVRKASEMRKEEGELRERLETPRFALELDGLHCFETLITR